MPCWLWRYCPLKGTTSPRSEQTLNWAWNPVSSFQMKTVTENYWLLLCSSNDNMTLSCGVLFLVVFSGILLWLTSIHCIVSVKIDSVQWVVLFPPTPSLPLPLPTPPPLPLPPPPPPPPSSLLKQQHLPRVRHSPEDDQSILIKTVLFRTIYYPKENFYMVSFPVLA